MAYRILYNNFTGNLFDINKICKKCNEVKNINEFHKHKRYKNGIMPVCKKCKSIIGMLWAKDNPDKVKAIRVRHTIKHKDELNYKSRQWSFNNPEKVKENRNNSKNKRNKQRKERRNTDIKYTLIELCRHRQYLALRGTGTKSAHTMELIGCSIEFFKNYLFNRFYEEYTGLTLFLPALDIHHIIPCHTFDRSDPEWQKKCFNYTNVKLIPRTEHKELHRRGIVA